MLSIVKDLTALLSSICIHYCLLGRHKNLLVVYWFLFQKYLTALSTSEINTNGISIIGVHITRVPKKDKRSEPIKSNSLL